MVFHHQEGLGGGEPETETQNFRGKHFSSLDCYGRMCSWYAVVELVVCFCWCGVL